MQFTHVFILFVAGVLGLPTTDLKPAAAAALEKPVVAARQMSPPGGG
jgi:hypothetical protein